MTKKDYKRFAELFVEIDKIALGFNDPVALAKLIEKKTQELFIEDNANFSFTKFEEYKQKLRQ